MSRLGPGLARARAKQLSAGLFVNGLLAACLLTAGVAPGVSQADTPRRPEELKRPSLEFTLKDARRATLSCGVPVYLLEDHDLPLCDLVIEFRMGRRFLPVREHPACSLLGGLWRDGGTESLSADSLDARLAASDLAMSSWLNSRDGGVSMSLAAEDLPTGLALWQDVILHPRFDADRLIKAKANELKDLQSINDNPALIADHRMNWLAMGHGHPTSHLETRAEIDSVTREELLALHRRFIRPEHAVIGVAGDFQPGEILAQLNRLFSGWKDTAVPDPLEMEDWTPHPEPGLYLLRGDYAQSQVFLGRPVLGLDPDSPDYPAASILSFGFGYGRVFYRARAEGLSYGATLMLNIGDENSTLWGFGPCRDEMAVKLLRSILEEQTRLMSDPLSDTEVETARTFEMGIEVQNCATPSAVIRRTVDDAIHERPPGYRAKLFQGLKDATAGQIAELAHKYMDPAEPRVILILGNPEKFEPPLDSLGLGPVQELKPVVFGE